MNNFTAHQLWFWCRAVEPLEWHTHKGASIRGAFYQALVDGFCMNKPALFNTGCPGCPLVATCPVAFLVSTLDPRSDRGQQVPRPYTVEPPLDTRTTYQAGEEFAFSITLFSRALQMFPYLILSMTRVQQGGIGRRQETGRRGRFQVLRVWSHNPLTGQSQQVWHQDSTLVETPTVSVTHQDVMALAQALAAKVDLTLEFLTPTRLVDQRALVRRPDFRPLFQRLLERLSALARTFSDTPLALDFASLISQAREVQLVEDQTRWVELASYSSRLGRTTPMGGILGSATYRAPDWRPFLPWLVWGELTHVGKDAVKGNGWYRIVR